MIALYPERLKETAFSSLWHELPVLKDTVDPFEFTQRAAALKLLIECTNTRQVFGPQNETNVFWGYMFQTHWQWRTGRHQTLRTPPGRIDPDSGWGNHNHVLCFLPFIAAVRLGMIPAIDILPPDAARAHRFAHGGHGGKFHLPTSFEQPVQAWQEMLCLIQAFEPGKDVEPIRFKMWHAHHATLKASSIMYADDLQSYSANERNFLLGWIRMVDFLAVAAWPTDLDYMMEYGNEVLPERLLTDADVPGKVAEMNKHTNSNLVNVIGLAHQSQLRFDLNLWLWKRAMRTRQARREGPAMLDATFNPSPENVAERRRLTRYMLAW